ncbi:unnamed protein product, partial [Nesidiocoris tenuis]
MALELAPGIGKFCAASVNCPRFLGGAAGPVTRLTNLILPKGTEAPIRDSSRTTSS